ncbi:MAG: lipoyl(octanoyl) transferase LipB [Planctomycetes bacterium]|nr:lipoyl(octanoyl) transferase LipB [Planctomycetota bacterium]
MRERILRVHRPGRVSWGEAWAAQKRLAARVLGSRCEGHLILLEHSPVFTMGRHANPANVLLPAEELAKRGIALEKTDRGGDVTYHGPGQVVGYLVLHLPTWHLGVADFVHGLESAMARACGAFGVAARAGGSAIGAWAGDRKIGSIGIHVSRGITTHGFALNASPDLSAFGLIHPCGMPGCPMTSLEAESGVPVPWAAAAAAVERELLDLLGPDRVEDARV